MLRPALLGLGCGLGLFGAAVALHGGVREEIGCVVDSPVYEIVNGPTIVLAAIGLPVRPEGYGELPPVDWVPPTRPAFSAGVVLGSGLLTWCGIGAAMGVAVARLRRG